MIKTYLKKSSLQQKIFKKKKKETAHLNGVKEAKCRSNMPLMVYICDFDDSSDKSIKSTTQHKIKTTGRESKHLSSQKLLKHLSKPRRVLRRSSSIEHSWSQDKNETEKGNKSSLKLRENNWHSFISKSSKFTLKKNIISDKHRDTHLEQYLSLPSFL